MYEIIKDGPYGIKGQRVSASVYNSASSNDKLKYFKLLGVQVANDDWITPNTTYSNDLLYASTDNSSSNDYSSDDYTSDSSGNDTTDFGGGDFGGSGASSDW